MNVLGVICEYNPFHNGHALHLRAARDAVLADYVVCVMSGPFVQRGDAAIVDKWTRARAAVLHGADLVIELPPQWAVRPARDFARGAVALLDALGVVTHLGFGSELPLAALKGALAGREDTQALREALLRGESWPRAVAGAAGDSAALLEPNATLGVEYLRALASAPNIMPVVVHRDAPHDRGDLGEVCAASVIRKALRQNLPVSSAMPPEAALALSEALKHQGGPALLENLSRMLLHRLRSAPKTALDALPGGGEGLGNRLLSCAREAVSLDELFTRTKCKRYTMARIRRLALHALLSTPPELLTAPPAYARVLAFRRDAAPLLSAIDRQSRIPLITKLPQIDAPLSLAYETAAQELWAFACPVPPRAGLDYGHSIEMV